MVPRMRRLRVRGTRERALARLEKLLREIDYRDTAKWQRITNDDGSFWLINRQALTEPCEGELS